MKTNLKKETMFVDGNEFEYETGIEWLQVALSNGGTATFHWNVGNDREYDKKIISAIRRAGGTGCNTFRFDGFKYTDGYNGTYGVYINGSMSVHGRFSVERI